MGAETARVLAARGANVGVNDVSAGRAERVVEEIRAAGGRAEPVTADVTDLDTVREAFGLFGPIDDDPAEWAAFVDSTSTAR